MFIYASVKYIFTGVRQSLAEHTQRIDKHHCELRAKHQTPPIYSSSTQAKRQANKQTTDTNNNNNCKFNHFRLPSFLPSVSTQKLKCTGSALYSINISNINKTECTAVVTQVKQKVLLLNQKLVFS